MKFWLVTWESSNPSIVVEQRFAGLFNPRWGKDRVKELVEIIYAKSEYCVFELMKYANNKSFNPYPAKVWGEEIHCGHNPFLIARPVSDFKIERDQNGNEIVSWKQFTEQGKSIKDSLIVKH